MQASGSQEDISLRNREREEWNDKISRSNDTIVELTGALRESRDTEEAAVRQVELQAQKITTYNNQVAGFEKEVTRIRNDSLKNEQAWESEKRSLLQKIDRYIHFYKK